MGKTLRGTKSRESLHAFWRNPDAANAPETYLDGAARSAFLVELLSRFVPRNADVLEIGCNVGRNLNALMSAGYSKLTGVEINPAAIATLRQEFSTLAAHARLLNEPIEAAVTRFRDGEFSAVYTMAVLEHIHPDSEWIFEEVARVTRDVLITIEDERGVSWRHFPRDYSKIFTAVGMTLIADINCAGVDGLGSDFRARVFRKIEEPLGDRRVVAARSTRPM